MISKIVGCEEIERFPTQILLFQELISLPELRDQLIDILQVSSVSISEDIGLGEDYTFQTSKSTKALCPRCRRVQSEKEEELCRRCCDVVNNLNDNKTAVTN